LRIALKKWRLSAIISGPSTTATFSGKAPGATTRTSMIVELEFTPSTFAVGAPPSGIQEAAAHPGGVATGIDPGAIRAATAEGILPGFSYILLNSTVCNYGQHSRAWPPMMDSA
jgi:hypothetical protein